MLLQPHTKQDIFRTTIREEKQYDRNTIHKNKYVILILQKVVKNNV